MLEKQFIDPEQAAHNVASSICNKFIKNLKLESISPDSCELSKIVVETSKVYSLAYDIAYNQISSENASNEDE